MMMKALLALGALAAALFSPPSPAADEGSQSALTVAVFGDWPYSNVLLDNSDLLVNSINADRAVRAVIHVGDIHSGSMPCTSAGILPPIATSNPGWNQAIFQVFQRFSAPFIYTPGAARNARGPEPHAHHGAGLDECPGGMAAIDHRHVERGRGACA
jgi:hypothetical protein